MVRSISAPVAKTSTMRQVRLPATSNDWFSPATPRFANGPNESTTATGRDERACTPLAIRRAVLLGVITRSYGEARTAANEKLSYSARVASYATAKRLAGTARRCLVLR